MKQENNTIVGRNIDWSGVRQKWGEIERDEESER